MSDFWLAFFRTPFGWKVEIPFEFYVRLRICYPVVAQSMPDGEIDTFDEDIIESAFNVYVS